jgi:hypothetical protein
MDENPELGQFYREFRQGPPELKMFQDCSDSQLDSAGNFQNMFASISDQLQNFEIKARDFDDFVNSLSVSEST